MKIRLPADLKDEIEEAAKANGRSMNAQIVHMLARYFYLHKVNELRAFENEREKTILATPDEALPVGDRIQKEFSLASTDLFHQLLVKYGILRGDEKFLAKPSSSLPVYTDQQSGDTVLITSVEKTPPNEGENRTDDTKPHTVKLKRVRHMETPADKEKDE